MDGQMKLAFISIVGVLLSLMFLFVIWADGNDDFWKR
jgi:hypothetical protein